MTFNMTFLFVTRVFLGYTPAFACVECGRPATQLCSCCIYEEYAFYCDECGEEHECGEDMMLPVVNSPRMGVCGYCGEED